MVRNHCLVKTGMYWAKEVRVGSRQGTDGSEEIPGRWDSLPTVLMRGRKMGTGSYRASVGKLQPIGQIQHAAYFLK